MDGTGLRSFLVSLGRPFFFLFTILWNIIFSLTRLLLDPGSAGGWISPSLPSSDGSRHSLQMWHNMIFLISHDHYSYSPVYYCLFFLFYFILFIYQAMPLMSVHTFFCVVRWYKKWRQRTHTLLLSWITYTNIFKISSYIPTPPNNILPATCIYVVTPSNAHTCIYLRGSDLNPFFFLFFLSTSKATYLNRRLVRFLILYRQ